MEQKKGISQKKLLMLRELAVSHFNNLSLFPVFLILSALFFLDISKALLFWLLIGFVPFLFYIFRMNIDRFFLLLISKIAVVVIVFLACARVPGRAVFVMATLIYCIVSFVVRFRNFDFLDEKMNIFVSLGIYAAAWLLGGMALETQKTVFDTYLTIGLILAVGLYLLSIYLENFINFLTVNKNSAENIPIYEIYSSSSKLALFCTILFMLLLFLTCDAAIFHSLLSLLGKAGAAVIRFLAWLASLVGSEVEMGDSGQTGSTMQMPFMQDVEQEPSLFWEILTAVAFVATVLAFFCLVVFAIRKAGKFILEKMKYKIAPKEDENFVSMDVREKCEKESTRKQAFFSALKPSIFLKPNERIRLYYKGFVKKRETMLNPLNPSFLTAAECTRALDKETMHDFYDKARYSNEECTSIDLKKFKEIAKKKED